MTDHDPVSHIDFHLSMPRIETSMQITAATFVHTAHYAGDTMSVSARVDCYSPMVGGRPVFRVWVDGDAVADQLDTFDDARAVATRNATRALIRKYVQLHVDEAIDAHVRLRLGREVES